MGGRLVYEHGHGHHLSLAHMHHPSPSQQFLFGGYPGGVGHGHGHGHGHSQSLPHNSFSVHHQHPHAQHQQQQQQPAQWSQGYNPTPQGYVANYHDPRSIQQPYYYGQTDPSVYNSPWPPTQQDAQTGVHTPAMLATTTQSHSMPYSQPSHSPADSQQHSYDSGPSPSYPASLQAFDVGNFGIAHELQSQQNRQARKSPSNMYFEDASMHLKMQSLPILDSLVSLSHLVSPRSRLQSGKTACVRSNNRKAVRFVPRLKPKVTRVDE